VSARERVALGALTACQERLPGADACDDPWDALREYAQKRGHRLEGFHHLNFMLDEVAGHAALVGVRADTPVKVRVGRLDSLKVVERLWDDEGAVLTALERTRAVRNTPLFYAGRGDISVHEFVSGQTLSQVCPPGKPLDSHCLRSLVGQLAAMTEVSAGELPPLPAGWAEDGDSRGFLRDRADFAEREVRQANWPEYGRLFTALEVPVNALRVLRDRLPALRSRPFALLHGDLHRHNVIVRRDDGELTVVDWELALWGDPLHDLAIHLVRMRYPADQRWEVVQRWRDAVRPETAAGLEQDLPVYVNYERAQSLFADTLRAARALAALGGRPPAAAVGAAVSRVRQALHLAAGPLRLNRVPTRTEVERALLDWVRLRPEAARG
jgi:aminoglycoside phosphotransferase (APT) family kinase protein